MLLLPQFDCAAFSQDFLAKAYSVLPVFSIDVSILRITANSS
jgi:hypothetical protein